MKRIFSLLAVLMLGLGIASSQTQCVSTPTTTTTNVGLTKPGHCALGYDLLFNGNFDLLDLVFTGGKALPWGITSPAAVGFRSSVTSAPAVTIDPSTGAISLFSGVHKFTARSLSTMPSDWLLDTTSQTTAIQSMLPGVAPDGNSGITVQRQVAAGSVSPTTIGDSGVVFPDGSTQAVSTASALTGSANDSTARASATAAQATANAAIPANGATSSGSGSGNAVVFPGSVTANTLSQASDPPGGAATALRSATQHYADSSQWINVKSIGCVGDGVTLNDSCFATIAANLTGKSYFFPAGTYNVSVCTSFPMVQKFSIRGVGWHGSNIVQTTDATCIFKFTSEDTLGFNIYDLGFTYTNAQAQPVSDTDNAPATAILFDTVARTGGGVFQFDIHHIRCSNASRCIATAKYTSGNIVPVWGAVMHDIWGEKALQGATINLTGGSGSLGGQPRILLYNIYSQQTIAEPQVSVNKASSFTALNLESNSAYGMVYDFSQITSGLINGLHIENYTQKDDQTAVFEIGNSWLRISGLDMIGHLCPVGTACNSVATPRLYLFRTNTTAPGSINLDGIHMKIPYGDSLPAATTYAAKPNNAALSYAFIGSVDGFTAPLYPGDAADSLFWSVNGVLQPGALASTLLTDQVNNSEWVVTGPSLTNSSGLLAAKEVSSNSIGALYFGQRFNSASMGTTELWYDGTGSLNGRRCANQTTFAANGIPNSVPVCAGHIDWTIKPGNAYTKLDLSNIYQTSNSITAFSIASNVVTFTDTNSYAVGQSVYVNGLSVGTYLNGNTYTVVSATSSQWTAAFTHADATLTTDSGTAFGMKSVQFDPNGGIAPMVPSTMVPTSAGCIPKFSGTTDVHLSSTCYDATTKIPSTFGPFSGIRAGAWTISAGTSVAVTFTTAMTSTPTSCSVMPTASSAATGQPYPTTLATTGFTVNIPTSGTISGTYQCVLNNAN